MVGYVIMGREPDIARAIASGGVLPSHRQWGIGSLLLDTVLGHATDLGFLVLHVELPPETGPAEALLARRGFEHVRTHWQLRREFSTPTELAIPMGYALRRAQPGEVPVLAALQNQAFEGSWGYSPNTPGELHYDMYESGPQPFDALVLEAKGTITAYCLVRASTGPDEASFIGMVGTRPSAQGQGLGRAVTGAGIDHLLGLGAHRINITVDSENGAAIRIYEGLGFQRVGSTYWYELQLGARS